MTEQIYHPYSRNGNQDLTMHTLVGAVIKILLFGAYKYVINECKMSTWLMLAKKGNILQKMERVERKELEEGNKKAQCCALNLYCFCFLAHSLQLFL